MGDNVLTKLFKEKIEDQPDLKQLIGGNILYAGTNWCAFEYEYGSVYGIAVQLNDENEKEKFFKKYRQRKIDEVSQWKSIGDNFYPLYWGKDTRVGSRMYQHLKTLKGNGTVQLNKHTELKGKNVIYGICICKNSQSMEEMLHKKYPDIYMTKKG